MQHFCCILDLLNLLDGHRVEITEATYDDTNNMVHCDLGDIRNKKHRLGAAGNITENAVDKRTGEPDEIPVYEAQISIFCKNAKHIFCLKQICECLRNIILLQFGCFYDLHFEITSNILSYLEWIVCILQM